MTDINNILSFEYERFQKFVLSYNDLTTRPIKCVVNVSEKSNDLSFICLLDLTFQYRKCHSVVVCDGKYLLD
jgi:hypothetical protein